MSESKYTYLNSVRSKLKINRKDIWLKFWLLVRRVLRKR